eukprot:1331360-Rhodomonas_salina.6
MVLLAPTDCHLISHLHFSPSHRLSPGCRVSQVQPHASSALVSSNVCPRVRHAVSVPDLACAASRDVHRPARLAGLRRLQRWKVPGDPRSRRGVGLSRVLCE